MRKREGRKGGEREKVERVLKGKGEMEWGKETGRDRGKGKEGEVEK